VVWVIKRSLNLLPHKIKINRFAGTQAPRARTFFPRENDVMIFKILEISGPESFSHAAKNRDAVTSRFEIDDLLSFRINNISSRNFVLPILHFKLLHFLPCQECAWRA
jgi:hypothetical protein